MTNIVIEFTPVDENHRKADNETKTLEFESRSDFTTEVLPAFFNLKELSCGNIIWIDSGIMYKRESVKNAEPRIMMAPVCRRTSGIHRETARLLAQLFDAGVYVVNAFGKMFFVKRSDKTVEDDSVDNSSAGDNVEDVMCQWGVTNVILPSVSSVKSDEIFYRSEGRVDKKTIKI